MTFESFYTIEKFTLNKHVQMFLQSKEETFWIKNFEKLKENRKSDFLVSKKYFLYENI